MAFKAGDLVFRKKSLGWSNNQYKLLYSFETSFGGKIWRISEISKFPLEWLCHEDEMILVSDGLKIGIQTGIL